jgi:pimeloyl-ACP methyl ester carboxylesterase
MPRHTHARASDVDRPSWLSHDQWPFEPHYLQVGDQRVHYLDTGQGPSLVFVEAGMWSFIWRDVISRLQARFRCVTLDFPGAGLSASAASRQAVTIEAYADILAALIDHLALDDLTLIMHDLGGLVALRSASHHPDRVHALVACQTFGWPPAQRALRLMLAMMASRPVRVLNTVTNLVPRLTATNFGVGRHLDRHGRRVFLTPTRRRQTRGSFHDLMAATRHAPSVLGDIHGALVGPLAAKPLLTIFGERNDPFHYQARWHELFPHAVGHVVPGGHHYPMCDDPDGFAAAVTSFLDPAPQHREPGSPLASTLVPFSSQGLAVR